METVLDMGDTSTGKGRIALCAQAVKLPGEKEGLDRVVSIAMALVDAGYEVDLFTSSFQHWRKAQRDISLRMYASYPFRVVFVPEPGYARNLDLKRIRSHARLAENLKRELAGRSGIYDAVYAIVPPNDYARVAAEFASSCNIPFVVDVSDLWPEAMRMALDVPVVSDIAFHGFARDAKAVYRLADGVVGTSEEYASRPEKDRVPGSSRLPKAVVYVGNDIEKFDRGVAEHSDEVEKGDGELWVSYAGTLGKSYDLETFVDAICKAQPEISEMGYELRGKLFGDGPDREKLERKVSVSRAPVDVHGYVDYSVLAAWLSKSDILVNSLIEGAPQSIVSKIGDYLAAGKPMLNTGGSPEFKALVESGRFGRNVNPGDSSALADEIVSLARAADRRKMMGVNARVVAEKEFNRKESYRKIPELVDEVLASFAQAH